MNMQYFKIILKGWLLARGIEEVAKLLEFSLQSKQEEKYITSFVSGLLTLLIITFSAKVLKICHIKYSGRFYGATHGFPATDKAHAGLLA